MNTNHQLDNLNAYSFQHMVNDLAMRVLGPGLTVFASGADGGRDAFFEGEAPYPSTEDKWSGVWYIQSKFRESRSSQSSKTDSQWLLEQIKDEITAFKDSRRGRRKPDALIIATNVNPTAVAEKGSFDRANALIEEFDSNLAKQFHIWGKDKIISLLETHKDIANRYGHFLTSGEVLSELFKNIQDSTASHSEILRYLIVDQFSESFHAKLEQAGSSDDERPGIHELFVDIPFAFEEKGKSFKKRNIAKEIVKASQKPHSSCALDEMMNQLEKLDKTLGRERVWFLRGGPGRGKSTIGQYFCQIQRASLILNKQMKVRPTDRTRAEEIKKLSSNLLEEGGASVETRDTSITSYEDDFRAVTAELGYDDDYEDDDYDDSVLYWTDTARIPIALELQNFAAWFHKKEKSDENTPRGVLSFLAETIGRRLEANVSAKQLKGMLAQDSWVAVFDGLDEVPNDVKDDVASEVVYFINEVTFAIGADILCICTSRPQGYSGQFSELDCRTVDLIDLSPSMALQCAKPILGHNRSTEEAEKSTQVLKSAIISSESVRELMKTPLQTHIMAVIVRSGERPPERRWKLFSDFYKVIRKREAAKDNLDAAVKDLIINKDVLLRRVHNNLGFLLHAKAEESNGDTSALSKVEFQELVENIVSEMEEYDIEETTKTVMEAATERLVLVNTPDDGQYYRFDVRQLQEFFAAEFIYENVSSDELRNRLEIIAGDSHWREVVYFVISALIEQVRITDFNNAVFVLSDLDEGENGINVFNRKMARGIHIVLRLLLEGVLEQDKSLRNKVKDLVKNSVVASFEVSWVVPLAHSRHDNSKIWLARLLIESVERLAGREAVGAVLALLALPIENKNVGAEAENALTGYFESNWKETHFGFILEEYTLKYEYAFSASKTSNLLVKFLINIVLSEKMFEMKMNYLKRALGILRDINQANRLRAMLAEHDVLKDEFSQALFEVVLSDPAEGGKSFKKTGGGDNDPAVFSVAMYEYNMEKYKSIIENHKTKIINYKTDKSKGVIFIINNMLKFYINKEFKISLSDEIIEFCRVVNPLFLSQHGRAISPKRLTEMLSNKPERENFLKSFDGLDSDKKRLLYQHHGYLPYPKFEMSPEQLLDSANLGEVFSNTPQGVGVFLSRYFLIAERNDKIIEYQKALVTLLGIRDWLREPDTLAVCPEIWGFLIEAFAEEEDIGLRQRMKSAIREVNLNRVNHNPFLTRVNFKPFSLSLKEESMFLPMFAVGIFGYDQHRFSMAARLIESADTQYSYFNRRQRKEQTIRDIFDVNDLVEVFHGDDIKPNVAAASLLFILVICGEQQKTTWLQKLPEIYAQNVHEALVGALIGYLSGFEDSQNKEIQSILGNTIKSVDIFSEKKFEELLNEWREISSMPVTKHGLAQNWLKLENN